MNLSEFVGLNYLETPHREFYGAVVKKLGLDNVSHFFPRDIETLIAAYKKTHTSIRLSCAIGTELLVF